MSEKIKVAIIGCGAIANSAHIPAYMKNEKAEIKYFCDIIPERADAAVEKHQRRHNALTASGEAFCKLGKNIKDYVYTNMWAENTADKDGVFDVDDSVTGIVRTDGPTITFNGAWAENIGEDETYIDFIGDKAGIRLEYGEGFVIYSVKNGMLMRSEPKFRTNNFYEAEINSFVDCVINHEHNRADIDFAIGTSKIMQAIYDSSELHREVVID